MGLLIKQGVHREEEFLTEENVLTKIIKIELNPKKTGQLIFTFQLMSGDHKGELVKDYVPYDPTDRNSWRYRRLREAAGVPYSKDEGEEIDIERLLLNKAPIISLKPRTYDANGTTKTVQNIDYITEEVEVAEEEVEEIPNFGEHPEPKEPVAKPKKEKPTAKPEQDVTKEKVEPTSKDEDLPWD